MTTVRRHSIPSTDLTGQGPHLSSSLPQSRHYNSPSKQASQSLLEPAIGDVLDI